MSKQLKPANRTSTQQAIWADVAPHLTSWPGTLDTLSQALPRFVEADWVGVYILENGDLLLVLSSQADGGTIQESRSHPFGKGVCEFVVQTERSYSVPDVAQEPRCTDADRNRGGALLAVPLLNVEYVDSAPDPAEARALGVLCVARGRTEAFAAEDVEQVESIAGQVAALLHYARQYRRLQASIHESEQRVDQQAQKLRVERDRADFLHHVAEEMTRTLDLDRVLNRTLARVGRALGVRQASILLLDPVSDHLVYRAAMGRPIRLPQGGKPTRYKRGVGLGGWVLEHNQWAIVDFLDKDPRWIAGSEQCGESQSALALPLSAEGEMVGVLLFFHPEPGYFNEQHVALATSAANHITVACKNAEMYNLVREQAERLGNMLREQRSISSQHVAILSSIAEALILVDDKGEIIVVNDAAQRVIGISADELVGQQAMAMFSGCPEDAQQQARRAMDQVADTPLDVPRGEPVSTILKCEGRIVHTSFTPMLDDCQQFVGTVVVLRDVTIEQELAQAKNEFVSIVSHELRTPMTSIKGYTDLLLKGAAGDLSEPQMRFLSTVKTNVDRMAELVQELLDISRIEAGRVRLKIEPLDIKHLMFEVSETVAETIRKNELTLVIAIDSALPTVHADKSRIIQVLLNLVSNAYRYTSAGGKITISVFPVDGAIQVDVADTGIGIPPDEQEKIFERFYRADHPLVRQQTGTGLGLPIARSLIELHRGKLWLESRVNQGSTFSFTLPLTEASSTRSS